MDRWEAGAGRLWGLCVVPGRMGGSAGEARAEGLRSEVLPPDTWLCACGAWSGQGCTGAILASSVLWLLGATGGSPLICGDCLSADIELVGEILLAHSMFLAELSYIVSNCI